MKEEANGMSACLIATMLCFVGSEGTEVLSSHPFNSVSVLCHSFSEEQFIYLPTKGHVLI